ncbi:virulence factor [Geitlerinema sp. PCC 9228]|uniref:virulence factor n=1 Tax=Geitlerinema sp. PCC 9228 TaxID=111611 RepID=UPI0008F9B34A|nr:virulence factor [Geitlerinema sp. PCC 9228]
MKLRSIETTPSPNCMKLNLDEQLASKSITLSPGDDTSNVPEPIGQLLDIDGVRSLFLIQDFITLTREGSADWESILAAAGNILGVAEGSEDVLSSSSNQETSQETPSQGQPKENLGQVEVAIQIFRDIPIQVRANGSDGEEARAALPDRFSQALQRAVTETGADYVMERYWKPYMVDFGDPQEVAQSTADEVASLIDDEELRQIEQRAIAPDANNAQTTASLPQSALLEELKHPNWKRRLKALQQLEANEETFSAIAAALTDERSTIRRWSAAILGASESADALEPLARAVLSDKSPVVRRTAGDALSDLANPKAIPTMCQALQDSSKLVRWRAARFLNEIGDESALDTLRQTAETEPEFDVRVEINAAIERIEGGGDKQMPMWMRLAGVDSSESQS